MNRAISHRGPDDSDSLYDAGSRLGLTHRRLSIIDLSPAGRQPMWDVSRTVCIVYNGEIYNYRELRRELERDGFRFGTSTDTEVILNLFLRDGASMLPRLNGIYAFALWDTRSSTLLLARDGIGVKPLYVAEAPGGVVFASELKALLEEPTVPRDLDTEAVLHYTRLLWCPAPLTMLRAVRKLPPGHAVTIADGRIQRTWQFYDLPFDRPSEAMSVDEAIARTRDTLARAVERQMVADVPVGAFLSGGLDSSSVVAFARQHMPGGRLRCFTIGFTEGSTAAEGMADDLPYAQAVAKHLGTELTVVRVGPDEMADDLSGMIYQLDEPLADLAPLNVAYISRAAREAGIPVLLSGAGGDDIFSGYRRHLSLTYERAWSWLPTPVRSAMRSAARRLPAHPPALRRVAKVFNYADRGPDDRIASYFYWLDPATGESLLDGDLTHDARRDEDPDRLRRAVAALPGSMPRLNKMLYLDAKYFLVDHNLAYTDKMSMAHGIEVRVPLLDYELVEHAAMLPVEYKQRGRWGKWILRKAMEGILPHDVVYRSKTGFGVPLRSWMDGRLKELVNDLLSRSSLHRRGIFEPGAVARLIELNGRGTLDAAYPILSMACIELWCRHFIDRGAKAA